MKIACFSMVSEFRGVPPIWGFFLASRWLLAGLSLASCWPLVVLFLASCRPLGFLLASSFPTRISLENRFFKRFPKLVNSLHENCLFFNGFGVSWGPPHLGPRTPRQSIPPEHPARASLLLASCWPPCLLLASCWLLPGFLLASFRLPRQSIPPENRFFKKLPKLVNSLHANACFSMISVFREVPPIWGLFLVSCWLLAGLLLASCWPLPGFLLASPPEHPARKSVFQKAPQTGEFSS